MRGRGDSVSLKLRGSTIEDRALLTYTAPNTFADPHYTFQANAYTEKTQDINTFTEERYEASVQLTDQATRFTTIQYHYAFRRVLVTNINNTVPPEDIPLFEQPTLVSQFGVTWARDARDNPADATKGSFNSFDFGIADTAIGSSASFLRMYYQNSTYHPLGRRFSFARAFRFGILQPYKDTVSLAFPAQTTSVQLIPLPERFFAGGGTSLRGFALNQAGPRDLAGFPVGGQAVMEFHQEFRFPMRLPFVGSALGGALFYDGGNVYSRLSRITFRANPPKPVFNPANPTAVPVQLHQRAELFCAHGRFRPAIFHSGRPDPYRPWISDQPAGIRLADLPERRSDLPRWASRIPSHALAGISDLLQPGVDVLMRRASRKFGFALWFAAAVRAWRRRHLRAALLARSNRRKTSASSQQTTIDRIVARVDVDIILLSDVRALQRYQQLVDGKSETDAQVLDRLIDQWIVRNEADTAQFPHPAPDAIDKGVERVQKSFTSPEEYETRRKNSA